ncbi:hypothetical protein Tco_0288824, partial [Tanacetum coccineum]
FALVKGIRSGSVLGLLYKCVLYHESIGPEVEYPVPLHAKACLCCQWYLDLVKWVWSTWYLAPVLDRSTTVGLIGSISAGGLFPPESLSPSDPSGRGVVLVVPSSEAVKVSPVSMGCLFPTESLGAIVVRCPRILSRIAQNPPLALGWMLPWSQQVSFWT